LERVARLRLKRAAALAVLVVFVPHTAFAYATDPATVKRQIRRAWVGNDYKAIRVARCESGLNPKATSSGGTYLGLWQFSRTTWKAYGGPGDDPRAVNSYTQTTIAWKLFRDRGWAPWPTCGKV
jgi:hypothetical protein